MQQNKDILKQMNDYGKNKIPFLFIVDFNMLKPMVIRVDDLESNNILADIGNLKNYSPAKNKINSLSFDKKPIDFDRYKIAFDLVKNHIIRGDTFLLNLTFPTNINTNLSLQEIFLHSTAKFKLLYKDEFVVFSPEPFIKIKNNTISAYPMKGTIDGTIDNAEKKLMTNIKEISEHNTIVDLLRNDLSMVAKKVMVKNFRYVEKIITHDKTLLQTSTKINGELPENWRQKLGDIILRLLPAGSISGAPKMKTLEIIENAEGYERGYFTGIFGYFDGANLESAVMIRYIEKQGDKRVFKSGGGITYFSNAEEEYQELIDKVYVPVLPTTI